MKYHHSSGRAKNWPSDPETRVELGYRLRVCRLGNVFHFFYRHPGDSAWIEETYGAGTRVSGNGPNNQTMGQPLRFTRADMPASVQVGIMTGAWSGALNSRGEFDYVRFSEATQLSDCTADFAF